MSEQAIEEKIKKIRQDLYNFNLREESPLNLLFPSEISDSRRSPDVPGHFKSSYSAEPLSSSDDLSPLLMCGPVQADFKEFTLQKTENNEGTDDLYYKHLFLSSMNEEKKKFDKVIDEKNELILDYEEKLRKAEGELKILKQSTSIEELKCSTRQLLYRIDALEGEKRELNRESNDYRNRIETLEHVINEKTLESNSLLEENQKLKRKSSKYTRKIQEFNKELEILNKTLNEYKSNTNAQTIPTTVSEKRLKKPVSSSLFTKKQMSSDIKTSRNSHVPRPSSKSPVRLKDSVSSCSNCRILQQLTSLYSVTCPNLLLQKSQRDVKSLKSYKNFFQSVQSLILSNSPPSAFKAPPGPKSAAQWLQRLIEEYLQLKAQNLSKTCRKVLEVLKSGLNTKNFEDIPRAISKLLVENEMLLRICLKIKKMMNIDGNASLEEILEKIEKN